MAQGNLTSFISRLDKELSKYADYRKELNRAPHTFVFHKRTLLSETLTQLSMGQGMTLNAADKEHIKKLVDIAATENQQLTRPLPEEGGSPRSASCFLCFLPSAPQASPKRPGVLRRRPRKFGGRRRAERGREQSQAGAKAED